jgi:UDP-3-O-[3-hydroxymyristoyl] glucosamine N-acyltransferase
MSTSLIETVPASWLARELGLRLLGPDREIAELRRVEDLAEGALSFAAGGREAPFDAAGCLIADEPGRAGAASVLLSARPRLDFIRAQHILERRPGFRHDTPSPRIHPTAVIAPTAVVENGASIGEGTRVGPRAIVRGGARIGAFCDIAAGAVIGEAGFSFERAPDGRPLRFLQLAGVRLGDHVDVGAQATINRGALSDTVVEDHVKIAELVHIGHSCLIGQGAVIEPCAALSGSVVVGKNVRLAPNCTLRKRVTIADGGLVRLGAIVTSSIPTTGAPDGAAGAPVAS